jgi:hypothetical protein
MDIAICLDDGTGVLLGGYNTSEDDEFPRGAATTMNTTTTTLPCDDIPPASVEGCVAACRCCVSIDGHCS